MEQELQKLKDLTEKTAEEQIKFITNFIGAWFEDIDEKNYQVPLTGHTWFKDVKKKYLRNLEIYESIKMQEHINEDTLESAIGLAGIRILNHMEDVAIRVYDSMIQGYIKKVYPERANNTDTTFYYER